MRKGCGKQNHSDSLRGTRLRFRKGKIIIQTVSSAQILIKDSSLSQNRPVAKGLPDQVKKGTKLVGEYPGSMGKK